MQVDERQSIVVKHDSPMMQVGERPSIVVKHEPAMAVQASEESLGTSTSSATHSRQSLLVMQQHLQAMAASASNREVINPGLVASSNRPLSLQSSSSQSTPEYVIPGSSGYMHVSALSQSDTAEEEEEGVYPDEMIARDKEELREQDRFLPIANVARIMKKGVPETGKIAKDAKECVQECVSEFISFITSEASERCQQEKRKTINGEDILFAMTTLGFENYVEPLKLYLTKYRESMKGEKILGIGDYGTVEVDDGAQIALQYQVQGGLHAGVVASDGTFAYTQAQVAQLQQQQQLHFNT